MTSECERKCVEKHCVEIDDEVGICDEEFYKCIAMCQPN